jgi:hypothetical protein
VGDCIARATLTGTTGGVGFIGSVELNKGKELSQTIFLVASQMLRVGEHAFDHFLCLEPIPVNACVEKRFACSRARAMCGNDIGDQWRKLVHDLHGATSFET